MEDVQGVLTLFCSGAAQVVCHALRVVELREQLEVEEEDGDRQEEKRRSRKWRGSNQRDAPMVMTVDDNEVRSELESWNAKCETITTVEQCAVRADSVHVRHATVEMQVQCVNVVIGVVLVVLLVDVRVVPVLLCDAVVLLTYFVLKALLVAIVFT